MFLCIKMIQGWQWQSEWLVGLGKLVSTANLLIIHRSHHSLQIVQISWRGNICLYKFICLLLSIYTGRFRILCWRNYLNSIQFNSIEFHADELMNKLCMWDCLVAKIRNLGKSLCFTLAVYSFYPNLSIF